MLDQRLRRCANISPALGQRVVFPGITQVFLVVTILTSMLTFDALLKLDNLHFHPLVVSFLRPTTSSRVKLFTFRRLGAK